MTPRIVAFSGPRGCGKTTIAEHLCSTYGYTRVAFADAVRTIAQCVNPGSQNNRIFLAELGQELRNCVPKFAILAVEHSLKSINGPVVIEDVRFPSEMEFCKSIGAITIRFEIDRESQVRRLIDRGDNIENLENTLDCEDELRLKEEKYEFTIPAVGKFEHIAKQIHEINRSVYHV